jgi:hypothetical protein
MFVPLSTQVEYVHPSGLDFASIYDGRGGESDGRPFREAPEVAAVRPMLLADALPSRLGVGPVWQETSPAMIRLTFAFFAQAASPGSGMGLARTPPSFYGPEEPLYA